MTAGDGKTPKLGQYFIFLLFLLIAVFSCKSAARSFPVPGAAEKPSFEFSTLEIGENQSEKPLSPEHPLVEEVTEEDESADFDVFQEESDFDLEFEEEPELQALELPLSDEDFQDDQDQSQVFSEPPEQPELVIEPAAPEPFIQEPELEPPQEALAEPTVQEQNPVLERIPETSPEPIPPEPPQSQPPPEPAPREPAQPREPPPPPPFLRPTEPVFPSTPRQDPPVPLNPPPELPGRPSSEPPAEQLVFSRIVRLTVGQILEIPFRGTGWVYLGELGNRRGMSYNSRNLDVEAGLTIGQTFVFLAEAAGTYILKFYKQDFIQDYIINDYVQVIVGESTEDSGTALRGRDRVIAEPRWPSVQGLGAIGEAKTQTGSGEADGWTSQSPGRTVQEPEKTISEPQTGEISEPLQTDTVSSIENLPEYIRRAKQEFDAGRIEAALTVLDTLRQHYPLGSDEAWWLYGQLFESNSSLRDIRLALEYYRRLVREYPQSSRAADAQRRIVYLERYYFNIR
jgi:hypothetical protein